MGGKVLPLLTLIVIDGDDGTVGPCDGVMPCEVGRTVDGRDAELLTLLALVVVPCEVAPVVVGTRAEVLEVCAVVGGGSGVDVVGGGAGVDEGPRTKAEAAAKSKIVGCMVVERDTVEVNHGPREWQKPSRKPKMGTILLPLAK